MLNLAGPLDRRYYPKTVWSFCYHRITCVDSSALLGVGYYRSYPMKRLSTGLPLPSCIDIYRLVWSANEERVVVLTFDDAVKSHRTFVAPLLKELGFGATFYVTYNWMDDTEHFMTWEEIGEIHDLGFEIGNHSWTHRDMGDPSNGRRLAGELGLVNWKLERAGVPAPVTFAYPGNRFGPEAFKALKDGGYLFARRGMQPETAYGKMQTGPLYDPSVHHPLLVPTTADAYPEWDLAYFKSVVDRAVPGKFVVLQFHGVPDVAHPWVHTDVENFKAFMQYLKEGDFKVISMKDLATYLPDNYKAPNDPMVGYRYSRAKAINTLSREQEATRANLEYWVDNMRRFHEFSWEEVAQVTGHTVAEIQSLAESFGELIQTRDDRITVLPYPGGRHPRIGFLEGMIDPMRGTKLSVFLPWDKTQYAILDLPEAIFNQFGLAFLGHTHVPTIWDYKKVSIENTDWVVSEDGVCSNTWSLPNGIEISAVVTPLKETVEMELILLRMDLKRIWSLSMARCVSCLKGAPDFDEQTRDNKILTDEIAAVHSEGKDRWILTQWDQLRRTWANPNCPCLHFDPILDPCKVGETVRVKGRIWFHEGRELPSEFSQSN